MSVSQAKMDFFEIGDKTSLICTDANLGEVVRGSLRNLGFKFHTAETQDAAIERRPTNAEHGGGLVQRIPPVHRELDDR